MFSSKFQASHVMWDKIGRCVIKVIVRYLMHIITSDGLTRHVRFNKNNTGFNYFWKVKRNKILIEPSYVFFLQITPAYEVPF